MSMSQVVFSPKIILVSNQILTGRSLEVFSDRALLVE